jgi:hypothetical protein
MIPEYYNSTTGIAHDKLSGPTKIFDEVSAIFQENIFGIEMNSLSGHLIEIGWIS